MKPAALFSLATLFAGTVHAQATFTDPANLRGERISPKTGRELPIEEGALGLQQQLRKLATRASLMLIVAHPDDEDGGMLTLYSRGAGARAGMLTLTRGEGGQNAMTGDFEDALGLIRTQELLAADRYFGADQMFGTEVDFGFSKTKEEAFSKWTHERVLYDAVRAVRLYRPLVIAAVFVGGVSDGHGQHQVSGEIAQEVFKAAADPKVFPELTREGILPWAPLKVYARVPSFAITEKGLFDYATSQYAEPHFTNYVTGVTSSTPPTADVTIHEGETDPLLTRAGASAADLGSMAADANGRLSYVQFARLGLGLQRTQIGPGVRLASPGAYDISYPRYGSRLKNQPGHESSFFDGIDTSLEGTAALSAAPPASLAHGMHQLSRAVAEIAAKLDAEHPQASAQPLAEAQHQLGALLYTLEQTSFPGKADVLHELRIKQAQLNEALVLALGLQLTAVADTAHADVVQGSAVRVKLSLTSKASEPVGVFSVAVKDPAGKGPEKLLAINEEPVLEAERAFTQTLETTRELTGTPTRPAFQREGIEQPVYTMRDPALRNAPGTPPPLTAWVTLRYHETEVQLGDVVSEGGQAIAIVPSASVSLPSHAQIAVHGENSLTVKVQVSPPGVAVQGEASGGWKVTPLATPAGRLAGEASFRLDALTTAQHPTVFQAVAVLSQGKPAREGFRPVGYAGLPRTNFYRPATLKLVPIDLRLPTRRRIGYLPGTGDAVADNLRSLGLPVTMLSVGDLTPARLASFDTVLLGVRTYNAHPDLAGAATQALFDFARGGGNVIVQYQTGEFNGADAPFPLSLGNAEKVVDETAPVRLVDGAPALASPNRITPADFNGWVEERGHGFLGSWDPRYTALTETHDPGSESEHVAPQMPQRGGLITVTLGKGHWTYCAFALYRQLPEAVPGAFRLLANLLALADEEQVNP